MMQNMKEKIATSYWTPALVAERLREAAIVLTYLPPEKGMESFDFGDLAGPLPKGKCLPGPPEISRMEETLDWTIGLDPTDAKIVWMRAFRIRWKHICAKFGLSRAAADQRLLYALAVIAGRLNGKPFPKHLSRNRVIAITRLRQERQSARLEGAAIAAGHPDEFCPAGKFMGAGNPI